MCGDECAGRPRFRDPRGRYVCHPCAERLKALRVGAGSAASHGDGPHETRDLHEQGDDPMVSLDDPPATSGGGMIPLDDVPGVPASTGGTFGVEPAHERPETTDFADYSIPDGRKRCPDCGEIAQPYAILCPECEFNFKTGASRRDAVTARGAGKTLACGVCGYSLFGLKDMVCPECGTPFKISTRRDRDKEWQKREARRFYVLPFVMMGVFLPLLVGAAYLTGGVTMVLGTMLLFAVLYVVNLAAYWLMEWMLIGFDAPFFITAARMASVTAITTFTMVVMSGLGFPLLILIALQYFMLLITLRVIMDIEHMEAVITSIVIMGMLVLIPFLFVMFGIL